jgi:hypothetical protein
MKEPFFERIRKKNGGVLDSLLIFPTRLIQEEKLYLYYIVALLQPIREKLQGKFTKVKIV